MGVGEFVEGVPVGFVFLVVIHPALLLVRPSCTGIVVVLAVVLGGVLLIGLVVLVLSLCLVLLPGTFLGFLGLLFGGGRF